MRIDITIIYLLPIEMESPVFKSRLRVLDDESVEESWNLVIFMVMSYDAVRRQPIGT